MRISDWSSDVCSSDLVGMGLAGRVRRLAGALQQKLMLIRTDAPQDMRREHAIDHPHMVGHPHMAVTARIARSHAIELDGNRHRPAQPVHPGAAGGDSAHITTKTDPTRSSLTTLALSHA